jgi:uncharacterized protein (DUF433 family)
MRLIKQAISRLRELDLDLFDGTRPNISVTLAGEVLLDRDHRALETVNGQLVERALIDVLAPFQTDEGGRGPDLVVPRPHLRITPRKLSGAPHVANTRVETQAIKALASRGYSHGKIAELYPFLSTTEIRESVELEAQLAHNIAVRVA